MEFNWLAIDVKNSILTKDFESDNFISFKNCDLSFLPDNILNIQFDKKFGNSFIQKEIDGNIIDFPISSILEVPNLDQIISIFETKLEENKEDPPTNEDLMNWLRSVRQEKLEEADIVILRILENGEAVPSEWLEYRQALRDLPQNIENELIPMPTYTTEGTEWVPVYEISFNYWPSKPS